MLIRVRVKTEARRERFAETAPGKFEADVKEKAERNAANVRVMALLARHFRIPEKSVQFVSGHHRPNKTFRVKIKI